MRRHGIVARLGAGALVLGLIAGCSGASFSTPDRPSPVSPVPAAPTALASARATPEATSPTPAGESAGPAPTGSSVPDMTSVGVVARAVELDDPRGDVDWQLAQGASATQPPVTPDVDVTRLVSWITNGTLYVEVTVDGQLPVSADGNAVLRLDIMVGATLFEAPIVCRPSCEQWGTFAEVAPFTFRVRQLPTEWVATFAVALSDLGPPRDGYRVSVQSESYASDYLSFWWTDPTGWTTVTRP